jgi:hypothetical protein
MSRWIKGSITNVQGHFSALRDWIGPMPSKYFRIFSMFFEYWYRQGSRQSCVTASWYPLETNGRYSYMQATTVIQKIPGRVFFEAPFLYPLVQPTQCWRARLTHAGIQACVYLPKLCGERGQGYEIRQRTHPRHDQCHSCLHRIYCNSGALLYLPLS